MSRIGQYTHGKLIRIIKKLIPQTIEHGTRLQCPESVVSVAGVLLGPVHVTDGATLTISDGATLDIIC